jgi:competence protein ComEA
MDAVPLREAIVATPAPPTPALRMSGPLPDLRVGWPRCAQLAAAFLLGGAATLLGLYCWGALQSGARPAAVDGAQALDYRVELNTATRGELLQLPGVGPALAERIEEYRRTQGGFAGVDDLLKVSGIGPATLERLRPLVYVRPLDTLAATPKPAKAPAAAAGKAVKKGDALQGPVNINTASAAELQRLPGIGPKKAQNIIDARTKKPFASVEELRRVSLIGPKTLEALRPLVTVDGDTTQVSQRK